MKINEKILFLVKALHLKFVAQRLDFLKNQFDFKSISTILDLGGGDGNFIVPLRKLYPHINFIIADIDKSALEKAREANFSILLINEGECLPFPKNGIDLIICNSVIEHATINKNEIWKISDTQKFKRLSFKKQKAFADEIRRVGKYYFIQTPHKYFPIESHTLFPMTSFLPRPIQLMLIKTLNRFWFKKTSPDWNLLNKKNMTSLFPDSVIKINWLFGFPKDIIAVRNNKPKI